jgi:hypothetical protein
MLVNRWAYSVLLIGCLKLTSFSNLFAAELPASERLLNYDFQADYNARYIWRGIAYSNGTVLQPSLGVSYKDFYVWVWGNYDLSYGSLDEEFRRFNEVDFNISYTYEWNRLTIEPSLLSYFYPRQDDAPTTVECSVKLSYNLGLISIFTNQTVDVVEYDGAYFADLGFAYERDLGDKFLFEADTSLGFGSDRFNEAYLEISENALNLYALNLSLTYQLTEAFSIRPHLEFTVILDDELRDQVGDSAVLNGGLSVELDF